MKKKNLKLDLNVAKSKKHPVKKLKSSMNLPIRPKNFTSSSTQITTKVNNELNEIDELILKKNNKMYSRSLVNPYIPLTDFEKVKELTEMNENSSNRLKRYSFIFEQIKKEIYDINNLNPKNKNIEGTIEEKEEEDFISPVYINNNINYNININTLNNNNDYDDVVDTDTLKENINTITLSNSKEMESMKSTRLRNKANKLRGIKIKSGFQSARNTNHFYPNFVNTKTTKKPMELDKEEKSAKRTTLSCNCIIQ